MGDNGEIKTPEQIAQEEYQERLERYQKNPTAFIEISELICAVMRSNKSQLGISVYIGPAKRSELNMAFAELNCRLGFMLQQQMIQSEEKRIVTPDKGGILGFARRRR